MFRQKQNTTVYCTFFLRLSQVKPKAFIFFGSPSCINNCMNNYKALKQTSKWLKENGLNEKYFAEVELHLVRAQKTATNILKSNSRMLGQHEAETLNSFLKAMDNKAKRAKLTATSAYKVMNIATSVNRKMFKAVKKLKQKR